MKDINHAIKVLARFGSGLGALILMAGCVTVSEYSFSFDYDTGEVRREYRNLASRQAPNEQNYSVTNDWAQVKKMQADPKPEFDPEVVADISRELYQDGKVLSGRKLQKVQAPKCFPSKAALFAYLHPQDWRWEMRNGEVLLFLPEGKKIIATNGHPLSSAKNAIIAWPQETNRFDYVVSEQWSGGESLLPYYQKEQREEK